jgi:hypothetical protein
MSSNAEKNDVKNVKDKLHDLSHEVIAVLPGNLTCLIPEKELSGCPETSVLQMQQQMLLKKIRNKQRKFKDLLNTYWYNAEDFDWNPDDLKELCDNDQQRQEIEAELVRSQEQRQNLDNMIANLKFELDHDLEELENIVHSKEIAYFRESKAAQAESDKDQEAVNE